MDADLAKPYKPEIRCGLAIGTGRPGFEEARNVVGIPGSSIALKRKAAVFSSLSPIGRSSVKRERMDVVVGVLIVILIVIDELHHIVL